MFADIYFIFWYVALLWQVTDKSPNFVQVRLFFAELWPLEHFPHLFSNACRYFEYFILCITLPFQVTDQVRLLLLGEEGGGVVVRARYLYLSLLIEYEFVIYGFYFMGPWLSLCIKCWRMIILTDDLTWGCLLKFKILLLNIYLNYCFCFLYVFFLAFLCWNTPPPPKNQNKRCYGLIKDE